MFYLTTYPAGTLSSCPPLSVVGEPSPQRTWPSPILSGAAPCAPFIDHLVPGPKSEGGASRLHNYVHQPRNLGRLGHSRVIAIYRLRLRFASRRGDVPLAEPASTSAGQRTRAWCDLVLFSGGTGLRTSVYETFLRRRGGARTTSFVELALHVDVGLAHRLPPLILAFPTRDRKVHLDFIRWSHRLYILRYLPAKPAALRAHPPSWPRLSPGSAQRCRGPPRRST